MDIESGIRRRALLIGSPYNGLQGPLNDVNSMEELLQGEGFVVTRCSGPCATRDGIRKAWYEVIDGITAGDAIVIYYSGHGGLVKASPDATRQDSPSYYQFLYPVDYHNDPDKDFGGLLDIEITDLLWRTTDKTDNVTVIFDCCHSAHIARNSSQIQQAMVKGLPRVEHDIESHIRCLRQTGILRDNIEIQENPHAVRIFATDVDSVAWEHKRGDGNWVGVMTEALIQEVKANKGRDTSWRTTMMRIRAVVEALFRQQRPQSHGPDQRLYFSTEEAAVTSFHIEMRDGSAIINAGAVIRVKIGDVYAIQPFGEERMNKSKTIATGRVTDVCGFQAAVALEMVTGHCMPKEGALALLQEEGPCTKWPIELTGCLRDGDLTQLVDASRILRCYHQKEGAIPLLKCIPEPAKISIITPEGVQIGCSNDSAEGLRAVVRMAEQLAKCCACIACIRRRNYMITDFKST